MYHRMHRSGSHKLFVRLLTNTIWTNQLYTHQCRNNHFTKTSYCWLSIEKRYERAENNHTDILSSFILVYLVVAHSLQEKAKTPLTKQLVQKMGFERAEWPFVGSLRAKPLSGLSGQSPDRSPEAEPLACLRYLRRVMTTWRLGSSPSEWVSTASLACRALWMMRRS